MLAYILDTYKISILSLNELFYDSFRNRVSLLQKNEKAQRGERGQLKTIARRAAGYLERQGLLERDTGNIYLTPDAMEKRR